MQVDLHSNRRENVTLVESLAATGSLLNGAVGLMYSPQACELVRLEDGELLTAEGPVDTSLVFEARVFNKDAELRWLNESGGVGAAVLLGESDAVDVFGGQPARAVRCEPLASTYLLWGTAASQLSRPGWAALHTYRVGTIYVPVDEVGERGRVLMNAREYCAIEDDYGNAAVIDERLLELKVVRNG